MRTTVTALAAALVASGLAWAPAANAAPATVAVTASGNHGPQRHFLARPAHGRAAVDRLGADLPDVAALNDMSATDLQELLVDDRTAWVHPGGRVYFRDPAPAAGDTEFHTAPAAALPYDQTFSLHSRPGSTRTIYLDFDGQSVAGTQWNEDPDSLLPVQQYPAFSLDGDSSSFSNSERDVVQSVWQRVSEDYAPFDVDVTTADPGPEALRRSSPSDSVFGTRALITPSETALNALCGGGCGGVAFMSTFSEVGSEYYQPAWIFPQKLALDAKSIAEAVSHEVGHNLGLEHDGTASVGYYSGQGAWAPIMGSSYNRPISQWSAGEYAGADNHQDDLATITQNGLSFFADDHGNSPASATPIIGSTSGLISTTNDRDVFAFPVACAGQVTFSVSPAATSPDLDVRLRILSASGTELTSADPASSRSSYDVAEGLGATAQVSGTAGTTVYAEVDGVGAGDPVTNGYSEYASLGRYTITATGCQAGVVGFQQPAHDVAEAAGTAQLVVTRTGDTSKAATVGFSRTGGTATPGDDFTLTDGTLTFAAGETRKTIPVGVTDDTADEPDETVAVALSGPSAGTVLGLSTATLTIRDDDEPEPAVVGFDVQSSVVDEGAGTAQLVVTRTGDLTTPASVGYTRTGGTATPGEDFALTSGSLAFTSGEARRTISVAIGDDTLDEPDETVLVTLSNVSTGNVLGAATTTLTIRDDDAAPAAVVAMDRPTVEVDEDAGTVALALTRSGNTSVPAAVDVVSTSGTADTRLASSTVRFAAGETARTVDVAVVDDDLAEDAETITVTLTSPQVGTTLGAASTTVTIRPSDQQPDAVIATGKRSPFAGDGVYSSGHDQTAVQKAAGGKSRSFFVELFNDGTSTSTFTVTGSKAPGGTAVSYTSGGSAVTRLLTSTGGSVELPAGSYAVVRVDLRIGRHAAVGSTKSVAITGTWTGDSVRTDTVVAAVKVTRR